MILTKQHLQNNFAKARETNSPYVFVGIKAEGVSEVIVIPKKSFDAKEQFYMNAYSEDLTHVMNNNVMITGLSYGDADQIPNII
ncbi:hypothetical protein [Niallia sp. RD1]|uniref:hypothetical protein n=1 Tax=Niallia sp. RD1 TaxID=2962858 RepID=UPI0020C1AF93|nr:hypothetical protein [Niallia sp. RD1]UTI41114.1 hypothetical protein NKG37_19970 [Niallia sp. RD1]